MSKVRLIIAIITLIVSVSTTQAQQSEQPTLDQRSWKNISKGVWYYVEYTEDGVKEGWTFDGKEGHTWGLDNIINPQISKLTNQKLSSQETEEQRNSTLEYFTELKQVVEDTINVPAGKDANQVNGSCYGPPYVNANANIRTNTASSTGQSSAGSGDCSGIAANANVSAHGDKKNTSDEFRGRNGSAFATTSLTATNNCSAYAYASTNGTTALDSAKDVNCK